MIQTVGQLEKEKNILKFRHPKRRVTFQKFAHFPGNPGKLLERARIHLVQGDS